MAEPKEIIVTPVLVAEVSEAKAVLMPGEPALYRSVLVPAGKLAEVVIRIGGKEVAVDSWTAAPKTDRNAMLEVRSRAFDSVKASTFVKLTKEPL